MSEIGDVTIPGEPRPVDSPLIRNLTIAASALTTASIAINLILQIAHFARKRPVEPDQRDRLDTATFALSMLKQAPGLVKQVRLFINEVKHTA
jgi:hypothetical protein